MTYSEWLNKEHIVSTPDTERAWTASQRAAWETVFDIVSAKCHLATREFIRELEAARGEAIGV